MLMNIEMVSPRVLPARWRPRIVKLPLPDGTYHVWENLTDGLLAILGVEDHEEHGQWLHLSLSNTRGNRPPSWQLLSDCRDLFMGDRLAVQILPKRKDWLNLAQSCLHLFHRLDDPYATVAPIYDHDDP